MSVSVPPSSAPMSGTDDFLPDLLFGAVPIVFEQGKGWTPVEAALPFLALLLGCFTAGFFNFLYSHYIFGPYVDNHGGEAKPEMRLPPMSQ